MKQILHVGCGPTPLPQQYASSEWNEVRFDIDPSVHPDVIGSITDLSTFQNEMFDALYCAHNIEHVYAHQVLEALREFRRVLKPRGVANIIVPDIQSLAAFVEKGDLESTVYNSEVGPITAADLLWGCKGHMLAGLEYMSHKYGFTMGTMYQWCKTAGFQDVRVHRNRATYEVWAWAIPETE